MPGSHAAGCGRPACAGAVILRLLDRVQQPARDAGPSVARRCSNQPRLRQALLHLQAQVLQGVGQRGCSVEEPGPRAAPGVALGLPGAGAGEREGRLSRVGLVTETFPVQTSGNLFVSDLQGHWKLSGEHTV